MDGASDRDRSAERPLVVGMWPGRAFAHNQFPAIFADSLAAAGCTVIDVADPLTVTEKLDILHIHWPEQVLWHAGGRWSKVRRLHDTYRAIERMRQSGTRIVWMAHNLRPHELKGYRRWVWPIIEKYLLRICDGFMTLAPSTIDVVRREFPALATKPAAAALHPLYPRSAERADPAACRRILSLPVDATIFVLLGMLRPYKGAEALIAAFSGNSNPKRRLVIAGQPATPEYGEHIKQLASRDSRILVKLGFIDDSDFAMHLDAADAMVMPYQGGHLHSGAIVHAISYGCPVIAPAGPFADDVAAAAGDAWVIRYRGPLQSETLEIGPRPDQAPDLTAFQPQELGRAAARLYRQIL